MFIRSCFVVLISLCEISFVNCFGDIHIKVFYPNKTFETHDKNNMNLYYNDGDVVGLRCIISNKAFGDGKNCTVTWVDEHGTEYSSKPESTVDLTVTLANADDGLKLYCKAVTKLSPLSLYVNFIRNKTEDEMAIKKPTIFWILIISICSIVGGSLIILITWSLISRLCKKKVKESDTQVIFSEDLDNTQNNLDLLESSNTETKEMGISNQSGDLQNGVMENDIERRVDNDSDKREDSRQNSLYVNLEECKRHGSSTEC